MVVAPLNVGKTVRIAQIAPLAESVPPKLYGGTERVVSWLTEELVSLGHDVTLFATGDSVTSAQLVSVAPRALRLTRPPPDPAIATAALLEAVADAASKFEVIHSHLDWVHLPLLGACGVPFLTTLHGRLDLPNIELMGQRFPNAPFVSISQSQRTPAPDLNWLATIHHGLPLDSSAVHRPVRRISGISGAHRPRERARRRHSRRTCSGSSAAHRSQGPTGTNPLFQRDN